MSDMLCITNRALCRENFTARIEKLAAAHPRGVVLREKDLCAEEYCTLARMVLEICSSYGTPCILHNFADVALELGCTALHLPLPRLRTLADTDKARFTTLGTSCHSVADAIEAARLGCTYLIAGHVFDTDCKRGLPGRGLAFLEAVCRAVTIPVFAIGGIDVANIGAVRAVGAAGACVMSGAMTCPAPETYLAAFSAENVATTPTSIPKPNKGMNL